MPGRRCASSSPAGSRAWASAPGRAREARRRSLRGWVRNRLDGSVEALLIGEAAAVDALAEACRRGPGIARVEAVGRFPADDDGSADFSERATA